MYYNRLDLELDDWLDPSMPKMYHITPGAACTFTIGLDFTEHNKDFIATTLLPVFTPTMLSDGLQLRQSFQPESKPCKTSNTPAIA
jgi:hypothetical protein